MDSQMLEFEESAEFNRQEIEEREKKLEEFEIQIENDRNEGLFFKNLRKKVPVVDKAQAKEEAEKIKDVIREKAGSRIRKNVYRFFIGLLTFTVVYSIASPSTDWRKVAVFGAILVALISQFIYEENMSAETRTTRRTNNDEENK
jgi:Fe2+ transport system protein B